MVGFPPLRSFKDMSLLSITLSTTYRIVSYH
jgi:hypothetical protein